MTQPLQRFPKDEDLEPDIIRAVDHWLLLKLRERRGTGQPMGDNGAVVYTLEDWLNILNEICPDAIARMLQAGAATYLALEASEDVNPR